ncbi:MAG: hypothetical protein ACREGL_00885 [Alphaproteobacteria bacterium]
MELLYFTVAAIALYLAADWALKRIERRRGRTFEHRTLVFFALLLTLSLVTFALIRWLAGG